MWMTELPPFVPFFIAALLALFTAASGEVPPFQLSAMCFTVGAAIGFAATAGLGEGSSAIDAGDPATLSEQIAKVRERFGIEVLVPPVAERRVVHEVIYGELCLGDVRDSSRDRYLSIIDALAARGAEAIVLGCTEIGLLVNP
mgnify:CR=1 FL=1